MRSTYLANTIGLTFAICSSLATAEPINDSANMSTAKETIVSDKNRVPPLEIEEVGNIEVLPEKYPNSWVLIHDPNYNSMFGGKVIVMDVAAQERSNQIKGMIDNSLFGSFAVGHHRNEFYSLETFHQYGSRGKRTDLLTIYDKKTLSPIKEIIWPKVRLQALPRRNAVAITPDEHFLMGVNFSPAGSITVVDLNEREVVESFDTPGCVLAFQTGQRSVSSLCSNGGMLTTTLDDAGHKINQVLLPPFFDTDLTPIFERPSLINGIAYFPSFLGEMHEIDLNSEQAKYLGQWSLLTPEEKDAGWRPGGLSLMDTDDQGHLFIIMNPHGQEGTQTQGGPQVWMFDVKSHKKIKTFDIPNWAVSIAVTHGENPLLVVTNAAMALDIFDISSGEFSHNISNFGAFTPLTIYKGN